MNPYTEYHRWFQQPTELQVLYDKKKVQKQSYSHKSVFSMNISKKEQDIQTGDLAYAKTVVTS